MLRNSTLGLTLVAVLALSAVAATTASATEGPFFQETGKRLPAGESRELSATSKKASRFNTPAAGVAITCTALKVEGNGRVYGSAGANAGTLKGIIKYEACEMTGNGEGCEVSSGKTITTRTVKGTLGYSDSSRTGPLLILFAPISGTNLATVKFTGTCAFSTSPISGVMVGAAYALGKPVEVGSNESEGLKPEIVFTTPKKTIWTESGGTLTETKAELRAFTIDASTLEGEIAAELPTPVNWGIFC